METATRGIFIIRWTDKKILCRSIYLIEVSDNVWTVDYDEVWPSLLDKGFIVDFGD